MFGAVTGTKPSYTLHGRGSEAVGISQLRQPPPPPPAEVHYMSLVMCRGKMVEQALLKNNSRKWREASTFLDVEEKL